MSKLFFIVGEYKNRLVCLIIFGFVLDIIASMVNPLIIKILVDKGIIAKNYNFFALFLVLSLLFFALYRFAKLLYKLTFRKLKNRVIKEITLKQMDAYFKFPYKETIKNDTGYFLSRIYDESSAGTELVLNTYSQLFISVGSFIGAFVIALYLSWRVTIILLLIIPPIYLISQKFGSRITQKSKEEKREEAKVRNLFGRLIDAHKNIRIFNLYNVVNNKINEYFDKYLNVFYHRFKISNLFSTYSGVLLSSQELIILAVTGYEVMRGDMTIGGLMGYMNAFSILVSNALGITQTIPTLSKIKGDIGRLIEFREIGNGEDSPDNKNIENIELNKVDFSYDKDKMIFRDLDFTAEKGEKVLVIGDNGSGKSTFVHILLNLLHPDRGNVKLFNIEKISALTLPFYFIPGTLKENVNYDNLSYEKRDKFRELIEIFNLVGYEDKDPTSFSTGEKQKCAIIMALLKDADLYIFDEPTSNVDQKSKDIIMNTILNYTKGKTLIVILHGEEKYYGKFDRIFNIKKELIKD